MNVYELLQSPTLQSRIGEQIITRGVINGTDGPRYQITIGEIAYVADSAIIGLRTGDRVWVALGWGSPKVIGLLGPDQNAKS